MIFLSHQMALQALLAEPEIRLEEFTRKPWVRSDQAAAPRSAQDGSNPRPERDF